jgi:hypothetical protein
MDAFNSKLFRAVNVPMSTEDQKAELEYIYVAAKLNGHDKVPIQELLKKHDRKFFVRQHITLQSLEKESPKFSSVPFFPRVTNKLTHIFSKYKLHLVHTNSRKLKNRLGTPIFNLV